MIILSSDKKNKKIFLLLFYAVFSIFLLASCGPAKEQAHPLFRKAERLKKNGEYEKAAAAYEKYLGVNYSSALTHSKLAELYNDNLNDPFMAAYHYKMYLKFYPDCPDRDAVESWIADAETRFAAKVNERNPDAIADSAEFLKIKEMNAKYRAYLMKLKQQNADLLKRIKGSVIISETQPLKGKGDTRVPSESSGVPIMKIYTVKQGDSLSKISRKVYGSSKYYKRIYNANRDTMKTEASLSIGQKLRIPQLSSGGGN